MPAAALQNQDKMGVIGFNDVVGIQGSAPVIDRMRSHSLYVGTPACRRASFSRASPAWKVGGAGIGLSGGMFLLAFVGGVLVSDHW
jgi:hypothetical protein